VSKRELLSKYVRGAGFLEPSLGKFSPKKVREWFADHGCPVKVAEDLRVFPVSDRGGDVVAVFERILRGADLRLGAKVSSVARLPDGQFSVAADGGSEVFDAVVVATGGQAYSQTGSAGSGYDFAKAFGHTVTPLAPSLSAFTAPDAWCVELAGLSLPAVRFLPRGGGSAFSEGPVLFTHSGITGPAVFALSAKIAFEDVSEDRPFVVRLVPDSARRFEDWERDLSAAFTANGARECKNVLSEFFPKRFAEILPGLCGIAGDKKSSVLSKEDRRALSRLLSDGIEFRLNGRRNGEEFVTAGGVALSEIDPETMESKLVPNLYFTGEVLDVDAVTGGFNLQACWSTGRAAGTAIAGKA
jgi:predicted Rossmann fold flavoprotein